MKQVAKLLIIDASGKYLLLYRNEHPIFGSDPDLPGGTIEDDEQPLAAMIREVKEEVDIDIDGDCVEKLYQGVDYSRKGTEYSFYSVTLGHRPTVALSWEHSSSDWLDRDEFLKKAGKANDLFMRMVYDVLTTNYRGYAHSDPTNNLNLDSKKSTPT